MSNGWMTEDNARCRVGREEDGHSSGGSSELCKNARVCHILWLYTDSQ